MVLGRQLRGTVLAAVALIAAFVMVVSSPAYETLKELAFDVMLGGHGSTAVPVQRTIVVDIDRTTLAEFGPWPWSRDRLAKLVGDINAAQPKVLGLDILIDGNDDRSPAALARRLAEVSGRSDFATAADGLPDGDVLLAAALRAGASVAGVALDPDGPGNGPPAAAVLVGGAPDLSGLWQLRGAIGPVPAIADAAAGHGIVALPGDGDARIRNVPLLVTAGGSLRPGLALEIARLATDGGAYVVDGKHGQLRFGARQLALTADGMFRLRPGNEASYAGRTVPAAEIARSAQTRARLKDAIVLLGSSAPEVGGLRPAASGALVPSVQIQADAVAQMLAGDQPHRTRWLWRLELLAAALLAIAAAWSGTRHPPLQAALAALALASGWVAMAWIGLDRGQLLIDPLTPPLATLAAFSLATFLAATRTRVREAAIRRRFEQQLPAAVVSRLLDEPGLLKLEGEARRVTAMFTDIEGFTSMTERAGPRKLVQLLDRYFDGLVRIVVEHDGMVEKIVGDGLHAIFNAPLDLADHPRKALACALAIEAFATRFRSEGDAAALGFGRTRIGIETGDVIVGDVGGGRRLDYTAHGDAMNTAARLEAANKDLGSSICIGPGAAANIDPEAIRPMGTLAVRGRSVPLAVFEPWPPAMTMADRAAFKAAAALATTDADAAAAGFAALAARYPKDASLARLAKLTLHSPARP